MTSHFKCTVQNKSQKRTEYTGPEMGKKKKGKDKTQRDKPKMDLTAKSLHPTKAPS